MLSSPYGKTQKTNLTSEEVCLDYKDDCEVIISHIYDGNIILSNVTDSSFKGNFTLFIPLTNYIEYMIECVEDSCSQRINSNITLEELK